MSDITEPKNRFDLRWYDEVICLRKANAELRAQLTAQEQAIQERGIALADALRELDNARAAIVALPACRCERSLDQQCDLSVRLEKAVRERDEARADNAALRETISGLLLAIKETGEQYPNLEAETWNCVRAARAALGSANPRANCTLVAFDGAERTVTLQFEQAPESCIGEKWVAMKSKP